VARRQRSQRPTLVRQQFGPPSMDFKTRKPEQVIANVMTKLKKQGKGIVLMHDFQRVTAEAMPELLNQLKVGGYRIVHLKAKTPVQTLPEYDALVLKDQKLPTM
jgi:peptidoglycan/xylan/chitin deacetylase (PgdA/CDA1 family)